MILFNEEDVQFILAYQEFLNSILERMKLFLAISFIDFYFFHDVK